MSDDITADSPEQLADEIHDMVDEYIAACGRDLRTDNTMSQDRLDKFTHMAQINYALGKMDDMVRNDILEHAKDAGWDPDQYTTED